MTFPNAPATPGSHLAPVLMPRHRRTYVDQRGVRHTTYFYDWDRVPSLTLASLAKRLPDETAWLLGRRAELGLSNAEVTL